MLMGRNPNNIRSTAVPAPLDRTDRELILALQKNARISNKELAELVGLAPSTCLERLRRLRTRGVLRGFHATVDLTQIGRPTQAIIAVRLRVHDRAQIDAFASHVTELPDALAVYHVSGADDYLVHAAVSDTDHLRTLVLDLTARPEVDHVETRLIFEVTRKTVVEPFGD